MVDDNSEGWWCIVLIMMDTSDDIFAACTPKSCVDLGKKCGQWLDGCGGVLDCGGCISPKTCDFSTGNCSKCDDEIAMKVMGVIVQL